MVNPSASDPLAAVDLGADYFAVFGLPPRYAVDRDELEARYLERAQAVHPDRFAAEDSAKRREAMERSALVNEAYRVLRDPVRRAEYLVRLGGIDLDSSDPRGGAPGMDQAFLLEMIERRENLEAAREAGLAALDDLRDGVDDEAAGILEAAIAELGRGDVHRAARSLVVHRYLQRLLDEIEAASEG